MIRSYIFIIKNKNFRNLWLAQITSQISLNMLSFALAIKVYQDTRSNAAVSLMLLSFGLPSIIFGLIAGSIVDFFDKRLILMICNISRVFILVAFFLFSTNNIFILFFLTILISIITQFFIPAEAPSIPNLVGEKELLPANSLFTISFYLSTVLGFILAGPTMRIFGQDNAYIIMSVLMLFASIFVTLLPSIKGAKDRKKIDLNYSFIKKNIGEGLKFVNQNERIKQSLILMTFSQALIATLAVLAPGFTDKILSIELTDASYLVMGPAAIGLVIGAFLVGAIGIRYLKGTIILIGIIAVSLTLLMLSFISKASSPSIGFFLYVFHSKFIMTNLVAAIVLLFLLGFFNSFISVPANTILQGDSENNMRGRVYGVLTSLTGGASMIPVVFSGVLADRVGVGRTLSILGFSVLAVGIYQYLKRREVNNTIR